MAELFRVGDMNDWANIFEKLDNEVVYDSDITIAKILSMYGGMGSLNDIVLHKNKQPLIEENNEFDVLSSKLYELCHEQA